MNTYSPVQSRIPISSMQNPYTFSINSQYSPNLQPYNFHDRSIGDSPNYQKDSLKFRNEPNLVENINIAENQSFARNYKGRLYGADPNEEIAKQMKLKKYRDQLLQQAQQVKRRKKEQKQKQDMEDAKLQKQFNDNIKIQAQKKAIKKEEPSYVMMRTLKGRLNKSANLSNSRGKNYEEENNQQVQIINANSKKQISDEFARKDNLKRTFYDKPTIIKRGGYHNQSSLDNPSMKIQDEQQIRVPQSPKMNKKQFKQEYQIEDEQKYQDHRIHQILLFQQHMLKKLSIFKKDVLNTSKSLQLDEELDKVKVKLRAKPLNMPKIQSLSARQGIDNMMENTSFYHLPLLSQNQKIYQGNRQIKKKRQKQVKDLKFENQQQIYQEESNKQLIRLQDKKYDKNLNDKNVISSNIQAQQYAMQVNQE